MPTSLAPLIERAKEVRSHAHAPYSRFLVGAALQADDGSVHVGCNVENRSYGLTICAERFAVGAMVAAGGPGRQIVAVAVVTDASPPAAPCGACREVLRELAAPGCRVTSANLEGETRSWTIEELLPDAFELAPLP